MLRSLLYLLPLFMPLISSAGDTRDLGPAASTAVHSERRVALVIGNGGYKSGALRNPPSDARAVARKLEELGFEVELKTDLDQNAMKKAIIDFGQKLEAGGIGLFYYAGHGIQHGGRNYLIPLKSDINDEAYLDVMAVDVNLVLAGMAAAQNRLNIVILDACRNNPFETRMRGQSRGLAQLDAPSGTFVAFATGPGEVAEDGSGRNSTFTASLVAQMDTPGAELEREFKSVRQDVFDATDGVQTPWTNSSVLGDFYFAPGQNPPSSSSPSATRVDVSGDADRVVLVNFSGSYELPAEVPAGVYGIRATFDGDEMRLGQATVSEDAEALVVSCDARFTMCQIDEP